MRGKLRDKRATAKRDLFKREVMERKRSSKRNNRPATWLNEELEDQDYPLDEESEDEPLINIPQQPSK